MTAKDIQSITIIGRRHFNKDGNTYFSAVGLVNGKVEAVIDYQYGYDSMYEQAIADLLEKAGFMPDREHYPNTNGAEAPWRYCQRHGINFYSTAADVARKKDL